MSTALSQLWHCVNIRSILFTYHPRSNNREMIQSWITYLLCKSTDVSVPWLLYIIVTTAHSKNHPTVTLGCDGWMNGQMGLSWAVDNAFPCSAHGFIATCVALLYVNSSKLKDCGKTVHPHHYSAAVFVAHWLAHYQTYTSFRNDREQKKSKRKIDW